MATSALLDYVVSPGEYIEEWLEDNRMSQAELGRRLGCSRKHVSQLVHGTSRLTTKEALRLDRVTGVPAKRWMQLEAHYQESKARLAVDVDPAEAKDVLGQLPLSFLRKKGYIQSTLHHPGECLYEVLKLFRLGSADALGDHLKQPAQAAFRQGARLDWAARATWLRLVDVEAAEQELDAEFDPDGLAKALPQIRSWSRDDPADYGGRLVEALAGFGVRLVYVDAVPKAGTYGVTRWFDGAPLVALSLLRKSDDQLWFTLFHELHHVLHDRLTPEGFVSGTWGDGDEEERADRFSGEFLIPPSEAVRLPTLNSLQSVEDFAAEIGIAPGIVVGRLHRDEIWPYSKGRGLIRSLRIAEG